MPGTSARTESGTTAGATGTARTQRTSLSTGRVVFLVIAAAAPMAAMVGNVPLALVYGNGAGLPAAYLIAAVVLLCFSVGYAAMSRRVINTGAFYTYIAQGIGRPPAIGAGLLAVAAYTVNIAGKSRITREQVTGVEIFNGDAGNLLENVEPGAADSLRFLMARCMVCEA